jgi:flagellar basal-body rod modification protein FlgD
MIENTRDPAPTRAAAAPQGPGAPSKQDGLASDFDTFLKLLTAQIRNQDPLEPGDATKYASQLATFSNVEQGVRTNALLERMIEQQGRSELAQLADWVGRDVLHDGPVHLGADPVTLEMSLPRGLETAELVIGSGGRELGRIPIDPDGGEFVWRGEDGEGGRVAPGTYELAVEGTIGAAPVDPVAPFHRATVTEVVRRGGETLLVLPGQVAIGPDRVTGVGLASGGG